MSTNRDRQPGNPPIMEKDKETVFKLKERNELEVRKKKKEMDQFETARNIKLKGYAKEEKQLQKRLHEFNTRISTLALLDSESSEDGSPLVVRKCRGDDILKGKETFSPRPAKEKPRLKITLQDLKGKKSTYQDGMSPRSTGSKVPPRQLSPTIGRQQPTNRHLDVIRAEIATSNHYLISTPPAVRRRLLALAEKSNTSRGKMETKKSTRPAHKTSEGRSPSSTNKEMETTEIWDLQQSMPSSQVLGGSLPDINRQPKSPVLPIRTLCDSVQPKGLVSSQGMIKLADINQEAVQPPSSDGKKEDSATRVQEWLSKSASWGDIASGEKSFPERSKLYSDLEPPKTAGSSLQPQHIQPDIRSASCDNLVTVWKEEESNPEWFGDETDFNPEGAYAPGVPAEGGRARFFIHPSTCDEMRPSNVVDRIESTTGKSGIKSWLGMSSDEVKAKASPSSKDAKTAGAKSAGAKMIPPDWTM